MTYPGKSEYKRREPPVLVTVLVVEDDEHIQQFIRKALTKEGYQVVSAADGAAALPLIGQHRPALILLDMWMPTMDGYAFIHAYLTSYTERIPIVVMTADHFTASNKEAAAAISGILIKPFGFDTLLSTVQKYAQPG